MGSCDKYIVSNTGSLPYEFNIQKLASTGKYSCGVISFKAPYPGKYRIELDTAKLIADGYIYIANNSNSLYSLTSHSKYNYVIEYTEYNTVGYDPKNNIDTIGWEVYQKSWWKNDPNTLVLDSYLWVGNTMKGYNTLGSFDINVYLFSTKDLNSSLTTLENSFPKRDPNGKDATGNLRYTYYTFYGNLLVQEILKYITEFDSSVTVLDIDFPVNKVRVDIPYPYKQFTDTEFFLTDQYGRFISQKYYTLINDRKTVQFVDGSPLGIRGKNDVRFTFCHNHNRYHINKIEQSIVCTKDTYEYDIISPYGEVEDLEIRYLVFFKKYQLDLVNKEFSIDSYNGKLYINSSIFTIEGGEELDILCFYTGTEDNKTITTLPMSGYIELKRNEIDRNFNNNLMAIFVNGKLIPRKDIIHMSNSIYKIGTDIKSRYNVDIRSMSPKISSIVPFYKNNYFNKELEVPQSTSHTMNFQVTVQGEYTKHNRYVMEDFFSPIMIEPSILKGYPPESELYITLFHHGANSEFDENLIMYTFKTYKNDYTETPSDMKVVAMLRYKTTTRDEEYENESPTKILVGTIPSSITQTTYDTPLFCLPVKDFFADTERTDKKLDGIILKFEIEDSMPERPKYIYYELEATNFEHNDYVGVFEFVVSSEKNGKGFIYYRKHIDLLPTNKEEIFKNVEEGLV